MTEPQTDGAAAPGAPTLQDLVDEAAFVSHEHQLHLADLHGDDAWNADLVAGTLTFTAPDGGTTTCRVQFLGTAAPGPGTWMWAWNNVNGFPDAVLDAAERTRATGLREAEEPEHPLTDDLPYRYTLAAKAVTRSWTHYSAPVGGGTRAWLLVEHDDLVLPAPTVPRVVRTLSEGLLSTTVVDHRRALASYASVRGLETSQDVAGSVTLVVPDGTVTVSFDDAGRLAGIAASSSPASGPEPETELDPAPEPAVEPAPVAAPEPEAAPEPGPEPETPRPTTPDAGPASEEPTPGPATDAVVDPPADRPEPRRRSWFRRRG